MEEKQIPAVTEEINSDVMTSTGLTPDAKRMNLSSNHCGQNCKAALEYAYLFRLLVVSLTEHGESDDKIRSIINSIRSKMDSTELLQEFIPTCEYYI